MTHTRRPLSTFTVDADGFATCKTCNERKLPEEFYIRHSGPIEQPRAYKFKRLHCKQCVLDKHRQWRQSKAITVNGVRRSYQTIRQKYGITLDDYMNMHKAQGGVCAICGEEPKGTTLVVDHCHDSKKVRGLLCQRCNTGIGQSKEDVQILKNMIKYLEKHNG